MLPQFDTYNALSVLYWSAATFLLGFVLIQFILIPKLQLVMLNRECNLQAVQEKLNAILAENNILSTQLQNINSEIVYGEFHKNCEEYYSFFEKQTIAENARIARENNAREICSQNEINITSQTLSRVLQGL